MSALFETVKAVFSGENWAFSEVPGREVVQAGFEAHFTRVNLHVQAFPELGAISVVSESSTVSADEPARRERIAELLMRVNQTLTVGNFEMDWDTGTVLFRATNLFPDEAGDRRIVGGMIHTTIMEIDRITPLLSHIAKAEGAALAGLDVAEMLQQADAANEAAQSNP